MRKIKYIIPIILTIIISGCGKDFLEQKNLYEELDQNFYLDYNDIEKALTAVYSCLTTDNGREDVLFVANLESDDAFGGGGTDNIDFQNSDAFQNTIEDHYLELWTTMYKGIFRTNMIISRFDQATFDNDEEKNQAWGEAHFLRAYFYLQLARYFGNVPLITNPEPTNYPKASADDLFAQIASDLKLAIESMPAKNINQIPATRLGHATKWAAEGLMARAFLFYTGYYNKADITLPDGSTVTKDQVVSWVDDCVANSGHALIKDFRNLWPYAWVKQDYPYATDNGLNWVGDGTANTETVFAIKFSIYGGYATTSHYSNQLCVFSAFRAQSNLTPWGMGYGGGPCNPQLWNSFDANDLRKKGTICDVTDPEEGNTSTDYQWGNWEAKQETGFWQKKYTTIQVNTDNGLQPMFNVIAGTSGNYQVTNLQDEVLIRFADILLMGAELGSTHAQEYYDQVRTRAGLASRPTTLENIKEERRFELAFEGVRYFDLLRWHDAESAFAKVKNIPIKNNQVDGTYSSSYRPETGGFLPIPESQVRLSEGVLTQNPGWE